MAPAPKYHCACGHVISVHSIARHINTKHHLELIDLKKQIENMKLCNQELKQIIQNHSGAFKN